MRTVPILAALLATSLVALPAAAQRQRSDDDRPIRVGFGGGTTVLVGPSNDALKTGVHGEGFVLVRLGGLPALRFNVGYQKFDLKSAVTGASRGSSTILGGTGGLHVDLIPGPVRPYVTASVGAFQVSTDSLAPSGTTTQAKQVRFGVDGGAGLAFRIKRIDAFVEGRVQNVYTERGAIDTKDIRSVPVSFGLMF